MSGMNNPPASHDAFGWLVVIAGTLAMLWTVVAAVYWALRPGETDPNHPKRMILRDDR